MRKKRRGEKRRKSSINPNLFKSLWRKYSVIPYITLSEAKDLKDSLAAEFTLSCMRFFAALRMTRGERLPQNDTR